MFLNCLCFYRGGTLVEGCQGYNNQYACNRGYFLQCAEWFFKELWLISEMLFTRLDIKLMTWFRDDDNNKLIFLDLIQVTGKLSALKGLDARLREIRSYLDLVIDGKLPLNHEILYHLQVHLFSIFFCSFYVNTFHIAHAYIFAYMIPVALAN